MEKPSELLGFKREETEQRFFNLCNDIGAAALFPKDEAKINKLKDSFFRSFDDFRAEGFDPKGKISANNLRKFDEYRNIVWTADTAKEIIAYLNDLR